MNNNSIKKGDIVIPQDFSRDKNLSKKYKWREWRKDFINKKCIIREVNEKDDSADIFLKDGSLGCNWPLQYLKKEVKGRV